MDFKDCWEEEDKNAKLVYLIMANFWCCSMDISIGWMPLFCLQYLGYYFWYINGYSNNGSLSLLKCFIECNMFVCNKYMVYIIYSSTFTI